MMWSCITSGYVADTSFAAQGSVQQLCASVKCLTGQGQHQTCMTMWATDSTIIHQQHHCAQTGHGSNILWSAKLCSPFEAAELQLERCSTLQSHSQGKSRPFEPSCNNVTPQAVLPV